MSQSEDRKQFEMVAKEIYRNHAIQQLHPQGTDFNTKATQNIAEVSRLVNALGGKVVKVDGGLLTEQLVVIDRDGNPVANNVRLG
ncbi:hypothetical protein L0Z02_29700 (plasmid) [Burkholderia multivorans]|uniref:Uncharacterized protein n=1 Tax=Burkholderia multivorans TaxID=87883 RepID=A0AAP2MT11_9BURK|nr:MULTISPECIES: hypothetical protein [Burkholderia cepacia complex]MBU9360768.1 hypothetical protein [Burkholderia multivorans]MCO1459888.1 hypothetical protein [Burkholderia multivorans]MDN8114894.1 hypothetical protein [Burkholderia vietnamiensis]UQO21299.1 hypothetical protein L0Z02_29700 [Burkholderia multivorans]HDR9140955.1 hypothetical protein [Burkholderia vietnamiensis]